MQVLISHTTFVRVTKGVYALRALMGDKPYQAVGFPKSYQIKPAEKPKDDVKKANVAKKEQIPIDASEVQADAMDHDAESRTKV